MEQTQSQQPDDSVTLVEPPHIDTSQPQWVQQERRIMFDVMQIMHALMTLVTMITILLQASKGLV